MRKTVQLIGKITAIVFAWAIVGSFAGLYIPGPAAIAPGLFVIFAGAWWVTR